MNALDLLRQTNAPATVPVYAVFGADSYLVRESIRAIARAAFSDGDGESAIVRLAGGQARLADVLDEIRTLPFFSRRRMVIVEEADTFVTKYRKELEAYAE